MLTIILFLIILSVLVAVHEAGHLVLAKWVGARVKEYAIGFPPRIFSKQMGETKYSLNATPLGGYVNIAGEEGVDDPNEADIPMGEKLSAKHPLKKIAVLAAGVFANVVLAWLLISVTLMMGSYESVLTTDPLPADAKVIILGISPGSPAAKIGLMPADEVLRVSSFEKSIKPKTADELVAFLSGHQEEKVTLRVLRNGAEKEFKDIQAAGGIVEGKKALGIGIDTVVKKSYPFFTALYKGLGITGNTIKIITVSAGRALWNIARGKGGLGEVAGPVGIGKIVGEVRSLGLVSVITFAAFLSINLAIINILPFPALDGGRILFTVFEWVAGKPVPTKISRAVHGAGFAILIFLMIVVTIHDIKQLF